MRLDVDSFKERRRQKFVAWWSHTRAKGPFKFVLKVTIAFSLLVFVPVSAIEFFVAGIANGKTLLVRSVGSVIVGIILSSYAWWANEGKYKNILTDTKIRATK